MALSISYVSASSFDPVRPNQDYWTCYDYSIDFARNNPEWGIVTMSDNPFFFGISHMVNYKIDGDLMYVHDGLYGDNYIYSGFEYSPEYFHFWDKNQTPLRTYIFLTDNRNVIS